MLHDTPVEMVSGCVAEVREGATISLILEEFPAPVAGWYLRLQHNTSASQDPIRFQLEGFFEETGWHRIASSSWRSDRYGYTRFVDGIYDTPTERGARVEMDFRLKWQWVLRWCAIPLVMACGTFSFAMSGITQREHLAKSVAGTMGFVLNCMHLTAAVAYTAQGFTKEAAEIWGQIPAHLALWASVTVLEKHIILIAAGAGAWLIVCEILHAEMAYRDYGYLLLCPPIDGLWLFVGGVTLTVLRRMILVKAERLIRADREQYDRLWEDVIKDQGKKASLVYLHELLRMTGHEGKEEPRQYDRCVQRSI